MKVIHKYRIPFMEKAKVVMPMNAQVIRVDGLDGAIWCWAIVDPSEALVEKTFHLFKTGGAMPDDISSYIYLGCGAIFVQMELMMYVFWNPVEDVPAGQPVPPFDWKNVQEK